MTKLRTLIVQPYSERGGSEAWLLRLLDATDELSLSAVLLKDGPFRGELEARGIPVVVRRVGNNPVDLVAPSLWLARTLRRDPPDVVLANVLKAAMVAAPAGRIAGVPVVWAKHDHGYDKYLAVPFGRISNRVIGAVEELAAPTKRADAVIIPPPLPDEPPAPRDEAREKMRSLGIPLDDHPALIMAGRLVPFKGVDDAIRALARPGAGDWLRLSRARTITRHRARRSGCAGSRATRACSIACTSPGMWRRRVTGWRRSTRWPS